MYGILISLGIIISILVTEKLAKEQKLNTDLLWAAIPWSIFPAIVGARLYHVLDFWDLYSQSPLDAFAVWKGGLGIFGGLIFGLAGLLIFLKVKKQTILKWLNVISVSVPLAQAVGRMGNFFNKELYGTGPVPFFAAEALLNLILFLTLLISRNKSKSSLGIYLIGYGGIRFATEFLRNDSWKIAEVNVTQTVCLLFIASGICVIRMKVKC